MPTENNGRPGLELFPKRVHRMIYLSATEFGALTAVIVYYVAGSLIGAIGAGIGATIIAFIVGALTADHRPAQHQGWTSRYAVTIAIAIGCSGGVIISALRESGWETRFLAAVVAATLFAATLTLIDLWHESR